MKLPVYSFTRTLLMTICLAVLSSTVNAQIVRSKVVVNFYGIINGKIIRLENAAGVVFDDNSNLVIQLNTKSYRIDTISILPFIYESAPIQKDKGSYKLQQRWVKFKNPDRSFSGRFVIPVKRISTQKFYKLSIKLSSVIGVNNVPLKDIAPNQTFELNVSRK